MKNQQNTSSSWQLLSIAIPLILANVTTPLLGLVDTAILGHMSQVHYLAGAAIGSLILTQLYWVCGFIKMSVTGLSAQVKAKPVAERTRVLLQGLFMGAVLGLLFILLQVPILQAGLFFAQASTEMATSTQQYFSVRVWGAPAALMNLALVGWLIGQHQARAILFLQVIVNLINIICSLLFVYVFDWGIQGVAAGTVVAEYSLLIMSLAIAHRQTKWQAIVKAWFAWQSLQSVLSLNSHILVRNLALQFTLAFVTFQGAQLGESTAATNAILMQFFTLIALGLDGIANAVEALVGDAKGQVDLSKLNHYVSIGLFWSSALSAVYSVVFWLGGMQIIQLLTNQLILQQSASTYMSLVIVLPLIAHWCFLFDGVFVGLTKGKAMRNSMLISLFVGFLPVWWFLQEQGNWALWIALCSFLLWRGAALAAWYYYQLRCQPQDLLS